MAVKPKQIADDRAEIWDRFKHVVNMTPREIESWLKTDESKAVGRTKPGMTESIGRQSTRKIIKILGKKKAELTSEDYGHMRHVYSFVRRHAANEPRNIDTSRWRYSLMNWGHDPVKKMLRGK